MPSAFDEQFNNAFDSLADVHGEREAVKFYLLEDPAEPHPVEDVIVAIQADDKQQDAATKQDETEAMLTIRVNALPRTFLKGDVCELPNHNGKFSYRQTQEISGGSMICRFTQPKSVRHGNRG